MAPHRKTPHRKTNPSTRNTALFKKNRLRILEGGPPCHWCNERTATTADHLIEEDRWPAQTPGLNELDNLVAACKPCNSSRGARYRNIKHSKQHTTPDKNEKINTNTNNYANSFFTDQPVSYTHLTLPTID
jgi:5-methylcytosine-specific restriction endonuclease McrA